jgi:hypothetical protein
MDPWEELWDMRDSMLVLRDDAYHRGFAGLALLYDTVSERLAREVSDAVQEDTRRRMERL